MSGAWARAFRAWLARDACGRQGAELARCKRCQKTIGPFLFEFYLCDDCLRKTIRDLKAPRSIDVPVKIRPDGAGEILMPGVRQRIRFEAPVDPDAKVEIEFSDGIPDENGEIEWKQDR